MISDSDVGIKGALSLLFCIPAKLSNSRVTSDCSNVNAPNEHPEQGLSEKMT